MKLLSPQVKQLKHYIEGALAHKFAGALSPRIRLDRERSATAISALDALLDGGVPVSGLSELVGAESSGRTTVALSLLAGVTARDTAAAWIDVSDAFDPQSAALCGVDLQRLLWVRCADVPAPATVEGSQSTPFMQAGMRESVQGVPRGGGSPHPRAEAHGMSEAVASLLQTQPRSAAVKERRTRRNIGTPGSPNRPLMPFPEASPYRGEQVPTDRMPSRRRVAEAKASAAARKGAMPTMRDTVRPVVRPRNNWTAMDRALRAVDLLLQAGGFTLLVLDLGSVPAEVVSRIPISTWFRFRAACERTRTTVVLLTQFACTKSSADAVVRLKQIGTEREHGVYTGIVFAAEVECERNRTVAQTNVIPMRKPPRSERDGQWSSRTSWAVGR